MSRQIITIYSRLTLQPKLMTLGNNEARDQHII